MSWNDNKGYREGFRGISNSSSTLPSSSNNVTLSSSRDIGDFIGSITCCHVALFFVGLSLMMIALSVMVSAWMLYAEQTRLNNVIIPNFENMTTTLTNILDGLAIAFPNNGWTTRSFQVMVNAVWPKTAAESTQMAETIALGAQGFSVLLHQLSTSEIGTVIRTSAPLLAEIRPADVRNTMLFLETEIHNGNLHHALTALSETGPGSLRGLLKDIGSMKLSTNAERVNAFLESPVFDKLVRSLDGVPAYVEMGPVLKDMLLQANQSSFIEHASASLALTNRLVSHGIY